MKKVTVSGYWFYTIGAFISVVAAIAVNCLVIMGLISQPNEKVLPFLLAFTLLDAVVIFSWALWFFFQFTIISQDGIKTRAIFRTIRSLKWEEVKEVRYEKFYVSVEGAFTSGWYVIDDGVERKQRNGLVRKNSHITVRATKRARKALETFWCGPIIEKDK